MKKRIYRATRIEQVKYALLEKMVVNKRIVFGVDVAKEDFFGVFMNESEQILLVVKWKSPKDMSTLLELLTSLPVSRLEVAMESSGTYGDALVYQLRENDIPVYLVSAKKSKDACEIYDSVPSSHDAKSAAIIANLHLDRKSSPWPEKTESERELTAQVGVVTLFSKQLRQNLNRLEAKLARYWPELLTILRLDTASTLGFIEEFGGPAAVAMEPERALEVIKKIGGSLLDTGKCRDAVESARSTIGVPMLEKEVATLKILAAEAFRSRKLSGTANRELERLTKKIKSMQQLSETVGSVTAAVLVIGLGYASSYDSAGAYLKACGLNLKEKSSGKHKGQLRITKRGPSDARRYLYMAVMRLIQTDSLARAWYLKKVERDGNRSRNIALVALMRKFLKALWHVGKGSTFDSQQLFDASRLSLQ